MGGGARDLVVLGTSAQVPTRERSQNGYLLRWDDDALLFDPGEGTQRQLLRAEVSPARLTAICITHFHGDHCLGLPGVLSRFVLDRREEPVDLYFPASGATYVERLRRAAVLDDWPHLRLVPVPPEGGDYERPGHRLVARPLRHSVDTIGWRVEAPDRRNLREGALDDCGLTGPEIGRLVREGSVDTASGRVRYEDVSEVRTGPRFAFVMDTAPCDGALELAAGADLLVAESTFLSADARLARDHLHLTAREAGRLATQARARRLVVTHFSARSPVNGDFAAEAGEEHGDVVAAHDLACVPVPAAS